MLSLTVMGLLACSHNVFVNTTPSAAVTEEVNTSGIEKNILYYINEHRKSVGLNALTMMQEASAKAAEHSADMAQRRTGFGHEGFEERVKYIAARTGAYAAAAENVAYGKLSAKQVVEGWLNSPGHKKNIEGNYTFTGIGIAKDDKGTIFFTQIFIRKQS